MEGHYRGLQSILNRDVSYFNTDIHTLFLKKIILTKEKNVLKLLTGWWS